MHNKSALHLFHHLQCNKQRPCYLRNNITHLKNVFALEALRTKTFNAKTSTLWNHRKHIVKIMFDLYLYVDCRQNKKCYFLDLVSPYYAAKDIYTKCDGLQYICTPPCLVLSYFQRHFYKRYDKKVFYVKLKRYGCCCRFLTAVDDNDVVSWDDVKIVDGCWWVLFLHNCSA